MGLWLLANMILCITPLGDVEYFLDYHNHTVLIWSLICPIFLNECANAYSCLAAFGCIMEMEVWQALGIWIINLIMIPVLLSTSQFDSLLSLTVALMINFELTLLMPCGSNEPRKFTFQLVYFAVQALLNELWVYLYFFPQSKQSALNGIPH